MVPTKNVPRPGIVPRYKQKMYRSAPVQTKNVPRATRYKVKMYQAMVPT
jgi:hypothetical protein